MPLKLRKANFKAFHLRSPPAVEPEVEVRTCIDMYYLWYVVGEHETIAASVRRPSLVPDLSLEGRAWQ